MNYKKRVHKRTEQFFQGFYGRYVVMLCGRSFLEKDNYALDEVRKTKAAITCPECLRKMEKVEK